MNAFIVHADLWELPFKYFGALWLDFLELVLQSRILYLSDLEGNKGGKRKERTSINEQTHKGE